MAQIGKIGGQEWEDGLLTAVTDSAGGFKF
jgi:hypothetical protein